MNEMCKRTSELLQSEVDSSGGRCRVLFLIAYTLRYITHNAHRLAANQHTQSEMRCQSSPILALLAPLGSAHTNAYWVTLGRS